MPRTLRYTRPRSSPKQTLLMYLSTKFAYRTAAQWVDHIHQGHVHVRRHSAQSVVEAADNDAEDEGSYILQQGDMITFDPPRELEPAVDEVHIQILYEDEDLLVCSKNGNLPVGEGGRYCQNTLVGLLTRYGARTYHTSQTRATSSAAQNECGPCVPSPSPSPLYRVVHRLDKETSGVVVLAKSREAAQGLAAQFATHAPAIVHPSQETESEVVHMTKSYIAVLRGGCASLSGESEGPVRMTVRARIGRVVDDPRHGSNPAHKRLAKLKMLCYAGDDALTDRAPSQASTPMNGKAAAMRREGGSASYAVDAADAPDEDATTNTPIARVYGKHAHTEIVILGQDDRLGVSVARATIYTGRTHQIRVHCAHMGFPVLGDKLYDTTRPGCVGYGCVVDDNVYLNRVRAPADDAVPDSRVGGVGQACECVVDGKDTDEVSSSSSSSKQETGSGAARIGAVRHLLHAHRLDLAHPTHGSRPLSFVSSPLEDFMRDARARHAADLEQFRSLLQRCLDVQ